MFCELICVFRRKTEQISKAPQTLPSQVDKVENRCPSADQVEKTSRMVVQVETGNRSEKH